MNSKSLAVVAVLFLLSTPPLAFGTSQDATLRLLKVDLSGNLIKPSTYSYTWEVKSHFGSEVEVWSRITAHPNFPGATVTFEEGSSPVECLDKKAQDIQTGCQIALNFDQTRTFTVTVTSEDETNTKPYTIIVTRVKPEEGVTDDHGNEGEETEIEDTGDQTQPTEGDQTQPTEGDQTRPYGGRPDAAYGGRPDAAYGGRPDAAYGGIGRNWPNRRGRPNHRPNRRGWIRHTQHGQLDQNRDDACGGGIVWCRPI